MSKIEILSYERDATDDRGRAQAVLYNCVIAGRPKALGKADLIRAIELSLPEQAAEPESPSAAENGSRAATFLNP